MIFGKHLKFSGKKIKLVIDPLEDPIVIYQNQR